MVKPWRRRGTSHCFHWCVPSKGRVQRIPPFSYNGRNPWPACTWFLSLQGQDGEGRNFTLPEPSHLFYVCMCVFQKKKRHPYSIFLTALIAKVLTWVLVPEEWKPKNHWVSSFLWTFQEWRMMCQLEHYSNAGLLVLPHLVPHFMD